MCIINLVLKWAVRVLHNSAFIKEWGRPRRNNNNVRSVFKELAPNRRKYIQTEKPTVYEAIDIYLPLTDFEFVSYMYIIKCNSKQFFHSH